MEKMQKEKLILEKSCVFPVEFFETLIKFARDKLDANSNLNPIFMEGVVNYNNQTHTATLKLVFDYKDIRKFQRDKKKVAVFIMRMDRGWNWVDIEIEGISGEELKDFMQFLEKFRFWVTVRTHLFIEYNPSSREC